MARYFAKRLMYAVFVMWVISVIVFALFFLAPGDPARVIAGAQAPPEVIEAVTKNLGLDQPILQQYGMFLGNLVQGDLGYSYRNQQPVLDVILSRFPVTLSLVVGAVGLWLIVGILVGIMSATKPNSARDRVGTVVTLAGLSFPTFVLGTGALYLLFFLPTKAGLTLFPAGGYVPFTESPAQWAWHLVLPWCTLAFVTAAVYARLTRGQMLDVLGEDYIRTARAKGLSERRVLYRHALRSTLTPLVSQLGVDLGMLLGGAIVTEKVFGLLGVGSLAVDSVTTQDRPVVIGVVLFAAFSVIFLNIVVDMVYVLLDARVRVT